MNEGFNNKIEYHGVEGMETPEHFKVLANKFSEKIAKNPIVVFDTTDGNLKPDAEFNKVREVISNEDKPNENEDIIIYFDSHDWIKVDKNSMSNSHLFNKENNNYKITKESFINIQKMMDELIEGSAYSKEEQNKMKEIVKDNFKDKIISDEDSVKIEK